jgi:RNA polymerase sigma factor (sigma-70 family)
VSAGEALPEPERSEIAEGQPAPERPVHAKLAEVARDHYRALLGFLRARTGSNEEASEVAQEAFARLLALDKPEAVGFMEGYLWKIAGNLAIDRRRQRANQARLAQVAHFELEQLSPSPESHLYTQQRLQLLEEAAENLPPRRREAFILRVVEERSLKEVASRLNVSLRGATFLVAQAVEYCQTYLDAADAPQRAPK